MIKINLLLAVGILAVSAAAQASPPMARDKIAAIAAVLPGCTGGWYTAGKESPPLNGPTDLARRLELLSRPSTELTDEAGEDLFRIAKALLVPATGAPAWFLDGGSSLKCPARPIEAVALMEYLVGERPDEWRGLLNAFDWLGLAYETGAAGAPDPAKARRYYLRSRMHSALSRHDRWSDGIDKNLIANIRRAGLRPYLDALAQSDRGSGPARMILAEEALSTDPIRARKLLLNPYVPSLNRLLELEDQGRVPIIADANDIAFWAEAWRTMLGYRKWASRMLQGVQRANGGTIPTSSERPSETSLRPYLDTERVADAYETRDPIPVRALVNPEGHVLYIEACRASLLASDVSPDVLKVRLDVARLYNVTKLPNLPTVKIADRPAYGWVILPAVHFQRLNEKLDIRFADLPPERCAYSGMVATPPVLTR